MTTAIAFHLDEIPFVEGSHKHLIGCARKFVDKWCAMAGLTPIWIDESQTLRKTNGTVYWSWQELADERNDHRLVFLDPTGTPLVDFVHPHNNVIYCIGADREKGFGDLDISNRERIALPVSGAWHGFTVVPIIAADRMIRGI